jgi:hypothetical protein
MLLGFILVNHERIMVISCTRFDFCVARRWGRSLARDDDGLQKQAIKYGFADSPTVRMKKFWSGQQKEKPVGRRFNSCRPHHKFAKCKRSKLLK